MVANHDGETWRKKNAEGTLTSLFSVQLNQLKHLLRAPVCMIMLSAVFKSRHTTFHIFPAVRRTLKS